jgi:2-dehydropantoate 2-reductase
MNRQVPHKNFLIIGRGRIATHMYHYLSFLDRSATTWHRSLDKSMLADMADNAEKILVCIKDDSIHNFILENNLAKEKCVHFSGSVHTPLADRIHPLFSFTPAEYSLEDYRKIPFIGEMGGPHLNDIFPEFENPFFQIPKDQFALYHALCVLSGNGMTALWKYVIDKFENELGLPADLLKPFAEKTLANVLENSQNALTGPWARGDMNTVRKNILSIEEPQFKSVYEALAKTQIKEDFLTSLALTPSPEKTSGGSHENRT